MSLRSRVVFLATVAALAVSPLLAGCSDDPEPDRGTAPAITVVTIVDGAGDISAASVTGASTVQVDPGTKIRFQVKATNGGGVESLKATINGKTATSSGIRSDDGTVTTELAIERVTGGDTFGATLPAVGGPPVVLHLEAANFSGLTTSFDVTYVAAEV